MNRFYIEKLMVSGGGHHASVIDFKPGLNFILGPSNTGKSLVMDCLDYMFGFEPTKKSLPKLSITTMATNGLLFNLPHQTER